MNGKPVSISGYRLLQQYMDQVPDLLTREIMGVMHAGGVTWKTPPSSEMTDFTEARWMGFDFLGQGKAHFAWQALAPAGTNRFAWDAIGKVQIGSVGWEWLLVTSFAHPGELQHNLEPLIEAMDERVLSAIEDAKLDYSVAPGVDWIHTNLHLATRLFALDFMRRNGLCVRTLFIFFYDKLGNCAYLPDPEAWTRVIAASEGQLGLKRKSVLERRIYHMYLPLIVAGQ